MNFLELKNKLTTVILVTVVLMSSSILFSNSVNMDQNNFETKIFSENLFFKPVKNFGFAFSIPLDHRVIFIITLFALVIIGWTFFRYLLGEAYILSFAYGLITGGALANFYERLAHGFVWDYLHLQIFGLHGVWNIADLGIIFGTVIWIFGLALQHYASHLH